MTSFTCSTETFGTALSKVERFTGKNLTLPTLSYVLIIASGSHLKLRATNLQLGVEFTVPANIEGEAIFAVEGSLLAQALSGMKKEKNVTCKFDGSSLSIATKTSSVKLRTQEFEDFPTLPTVDNSTCMSIDSALLAHGIKSVAYAAANNDIKPEIASVFVYPAEDQLIFVATDSFRLAEKKIKMKNRYEMKGIMIPVKNALEIASLSEYISEEVSVCISDDLLSISNESIYVTSRLIDGVFPDYRQIIPKESTTEAIVLRQDLSDIMKTAVVFSNKQSQIDLIIDPAGKKMTVISQNPDKGEIVTTLEASLSGEALETRVNHRYVMDMFNSLEKDSVVIGGTQPTRPLLVRPIGDQSFQYLIMPMNR